MANIIRSPQSRRDSAEIWLHIALDNVTAADRLIDVLDNKFHLLAESPRLGRTRNELGAGVRSYPVGNYLIIYQPVADGIEVVRVVHGARHLRRLFKRKR